MSNIVHRGTLTQEKLNELCDALNLQENRFVIEKQEDGNWIGRTLKHGNPVEVREVDPTYCLQALITHE